MKEFVNLPATRRISIQGPANAGGQAGGRQPRRPRTLSGKIVKRATTTPTTRSTYEMPLQVNPNVARAADGYRLTMRLGASKQANRSLNQVA